MERPPELGSRDLHHSLLNHIAVITTNAYLLKHSELDDEQAEIVADIAESAKQAHALLLQMKKARDGDGPTTPDVSEA